MVLVSNDVAWLSCVGVWRVGDRQPGGGVDGKGGDEGGGDVEEEYKEQHRR